MGRDSVVCQNKQQLFGQTVNDDLYGRIARGRWELLNEIHQDGIPGPLRDRELLQEAIGPVLLWLRMGTGGARLAIVLDELQEPWPCIVSPDLVECLRLAEVT